MLDLVGATNLEVTNDRKSEPTFRTINGESWIDVTFTRRVEVSGWKVCEDETLSDHRRIQFKTNNLEEQGPEGPRRLITSKTDWGGFQRALRRKLQRLNGINLGADEAAKQLQQAAIAALKVSTPTSRPGYNRGTHGGTRSLNVAGGQ